MQTYSLASTSRSMIGRKVKQFRAKGSVPATVYGKHIPSRSIVMKADAFVEIYKQAGETGLIQLTVDKAHVPVLIHRVQRDPITSQILHVEFYQVDLKEKVKTKVPVVAIGTSSVIEEKIGVLLTLVSDVEVEALPTDLPDKLELDISGLTQVDQELKVSDLHVGTSVIVLTDPDVAIFKVSELVSREAEAEVAKEAAAEAAVESAQSPTELDGAKPAEVKPEETVAK
jgi:large subunit ribosomal protein L25